MATWIAHMRVAEHFMKKHTHLNNKEFLVGNIGPDCGVPNEDWSIFTPDVATTHWQRGETKRSIDAKGFKQSYVNREDEKHPFYLGYYYHLITDIEWGKMYERKKQDSVYSDGLVADPNFIWTIKKDWYGQDHLYLQRNPDCVFFSIFSKIDSFENIYFDFYPENAFIRQIKYITEYYLSRKEDPNRDFPFLSQSEMDDFVKSTIEVISAL